MSRNELRLAYIAAADAFDKDEWHWSSNWYWSSTQSSSDGAWFQHFRHGNQNVLNKHFELQVRLARLIPL